MLVFPQKSLLQGNSEVPEGTRQVWGSLKEERKAVVKQENRQVEGRSFLTTVHELVAQPGHLSPPEGTVCCTCIYNPCTYNHLFMPRQ